MSRIGNFRVWPYRDQLTRGCRCRGLGGEASSRARTGAFSFRVDSDIGGDLGRAQAARHFLIDGTALESLTLKCRAITRTAKPGSDL